MKNIFTAVVMSWFILFMSCGYAQSYEDYLDEVAEYENCVSVSEVFPGFGFCEVPDDYNPCKTNFSGINSCTPPEDIPCAVYVVESGNLHINDVYVEGLISVDYIKMIHEDGSFYIEEIMND